MTERLTVDSINSDQLDRLYDDLAIVTARACRDSEDLATAQAERDGAYRERAHLVALLAAMTDGAVIAPAPDVDEPGWQIAYLTIGKWQASWHISPRDADLFRGVEHVAVDDPRAQWDGHATDQKYTRIRNHTRVREMNRRLGGRAQQPASTAPLAAGLPLVQGRCPACGRASLFLGNGGHVTCSIIDCPNPSAADEQLHGEQPRPAATDADTAIARIQRLLNTGPIGTCCDHLVRAALGPAKQAAPPPGPCPACRRADQAGLAPNEQHAGCAKEQH